MHNFTKARDVNVHGSHYFVGNMSKKEKETRSGDKYLQIVLSDETGMMLASVFRNMDVYKKLKDISDGEYVKAFIRCTGKDNNFTNIDIQDIDSEPRPLDGMADINYLEDQLRKITLEIKDKALQDLVKNVLKRPDILPAFKTAPYSAYGGYSFDGGLLMHMVRMAHLTVQVTKIFNNWSGYKTPTDAKLDRDVLLTASLLYSVGKVKMFNKQGSVIHKTEEGELFSYQYIGMKMIGEELNKSQLSDRQKMFLEHLLGSSQYGKYSYMARSKEAIAFHHIQSLDMQMSEFEYLKVVSEEGQLFGKTFSKKLYLEDYEHPTMQPAMGQGGQPMPYPNQPMPQQQQPMYNQVPQQPMYNQGPAQQPGYNQAPQGNVIF